MRERLRIFLAVHRAHADTRLRALGAAAWAERLDLVVLVGLALWVWAWWPVSRAVAVGGPAAVLVWFGLPPRPPFIRRDGKD